MGVVMICERMFGMLLECQVISEMLCSSKLIQALVLHFLKQLKQQLSLVMHNLLKSLMFKSRIFWDVSANKLGQQTYTRCTDLC